MTHSKTAIITGAAGNLGATLVAMLAGRGWRVAAVDRAGAPLAERCPLAALHLTADDLAEPEQAALVLAQARDGLGRVDGLATTVGGFAWAMLDDSPAALWAQMFRLNVLTAANLFRAAIPHMRDAGGSLVAVGAGAALRAPAGMAAYAAAKSGVLRLVESTADEHKRIRIRANAVLPGTMDTPQNRASMPDVDPTLWTTTAEVAEAIAFLLSDAASGVTGAAIAVPGRG